MLVLKRDVSERIVIISPSGERIYIMLTEVRGNKARLGVEAPRSWAIHREEVQQRIDKDKRRE